jgi:recombination protein RecA
VLRLRVEPVSALDDALRDIDRQLGKGTAYRLGSMERVPVKVIPTGAITLDRALGVGGIARGRIAEVYGPESSGKTTLVLQTIANAQAAGLEVAMIDSEHALDPGYAEALGVDLDRLIFSQPDTAEHALQIVDRLVRTGEVGLVAVDSVAAMTPRAELDGDMGDAHVGLLARLMSQAMRKLAGEARRTETALVFTNQIREKIGVMFGSPETQPGGRALKFYASQRLDVRRVSTTKDGTESVGNRTKVTVKKNKLAAPFRVAEFDIDFGRGVSTAGCLIDLGVELGVVKKRGSYLDWPNADGEVVSENGRPKAKALLDAEPDLMAALYEAVTKAPGF